MSLGLANLAVRAQLWTGESGLVLAGILLVAIGRYKRSEALGE